MITLLAVLTMSDMMLICVCACGLLGAITGIVVYQVSKKSRIKSDNRDVAEQRDALMQEQEYLDANDKNQTVMSRNVIYSVGLDGQMRAGKYMLTSADESNGKFNVRFNGLVKEYSDGDVLTLTDGDTVSPVSGSVVITAVEE